MTKKLKVAVLMGGSSAEREVSLSTGRQILQSLDPEKYVVYSLDTGFRAGQRRVTDSSAGGRTLPAANGNIVPVSLLASDGTTQISTLDQVGQVAPLDRPDVVFIALHGPGGEDGTVQGMLEVLGLPYTGSGVLASALAMDKAMSKRVLMADGVKMPRDVTVKRANQKYDIPSGMTPPWIVKPNSQGSTIGVTVVDKKEQLAAALATAFEHDDTALVEQFITGTEITVPIIGNDDLEILPIVEIVPASGFYDYEAKYTPGATDEIVPARIESSIAAEAREIAYKCHRVLGCRGMSRTDMIVTEAGEIYVLEVNTIPGMTPTSLLPRAAEAAGIPFPQLLDRLIVLALEGKG